MAWICGRGREGSFLKFLFVGRKNIGAFFYGWNVLKRDLFQRRILSAVVIVFAYRTIGKELIFSF